MFNFAPPTPVNVGAILASFEATRKRSREDAEYQRKQQEEAVARQHLGPALAGDPNALSALFSASPERGMAVAKYLDGKAAADLNRKLIEARIARLQAPGRGGGGRGAVAGVPLPPGAEEEEAPLAGMPSGLGPVPPGGAAGGIPGGPLPQRMPQATAALGGGPAPSPGSAPYSMIDPNAAPAPTMAAMPAAGALPGAGRLSPEALAEAIAARRAGMPTGGPAIMPAGGAPAGVPREIMPGVVPAQAEGGGMVGQPQRGAPPVDYPAAVGGGYQQAFDGRGKPIIGPNGSIGMYPPGKARTNANLVFVPMKGPKGAGVGEEGAPAPVKVPPGWRAGANGTLEPVPGGPYDPATIEAQARAREAAKPPKDEKPPNNEQARDAGFADRMIDAEKSLQRFEGVLGSQRGRALEALPGGLGNYLQTPEYQQAEQAKRNFINAQLRRESGAAIGKDEFASADRQYFPMPGDSPAVIEQKRRNRELAIEGMKRGAGPTYRPILPPSGASGGAPTGGTDYRRKYNLE